MKPTQKHTSTKAILLATLVLFGMIVSPVCAITTFEQLQGILSSHVVSVNVYGSFTYDGSIDGDAIYRVQFSVPRDSYVNFTLYYGTASSVTGSASSIPTGGLNILETTSTVELDGVSKSYTFFDTAPLYDYDITGYASNGSDFVGFAVYSKDYGAPVLGNDLIVGYIVPDITHNLIYKIEFSSPRPFSLAYTSAAKEDIVKRIVTGTETGLVDEIKKIRDFAWLIWESLYTVVTELFYFIKFFFWDNLGMTIALYISISMAYAANTSKNIFKFLGRFFNDQRKLFEFILSLWTTLVNIIAEFRSIFRL
jgi:hypothetical protein